MTITDYNSLVAAISQVAEDDGTEFATFMPTAIDLAEERLFKDLDLMDLEIKATGNLTEGSFNLAKPADYRFAKHFIITTADQFSSAFSSAFAQQPQSRVVLKKRTEDFIQDYWANPFLTDVPKYYADESVSQFVIVPTPSITYRYELKYTAQPIKLSASNLTNYFTAQCKDLLYSATMSEMAKFMKAWSQVSTWDAEYQRLSQAWNLQEARKRRDSTETPMSSLGPNTMKHTAQSGA